MKYIWVLFYLFSIIISNLFVDWFGIISVGPLIFPAGAAFVGISFSFRDYVQKYFGKTKCWIWMGIATVLTMSFSQGIALASGLAFVISEFVDWLVFTYSNLSFKNRVLLSNIISIPLDSLIFVPLVFGWVWPAILGQAFVKIICGGFVIFFVKNNITDVK